MPCSELAIPGNGHDARHRRSASPIVAVHLDLKGVMFKPRYHAQLLRDLASQGVNAVLVEYEDIFPFDGIEVAWDPSVCWTTQTLRRFLALAAESGIEVIPLQQTLGHLEYVFRWDRYRRYAEDRKYPSTLALSSGAGRRLVVGLAHIVLGQPGGMGVRPAPPRSHPCPARYV